MHHEGGQDQERQELKHGSKATRVHVANQEAAQDEVASSKLRRAASPLASTRLDFAVARLHSALVAVARIHGSLGRWAPFAQATIAVPPSGQPGTLADRLALTIVAAPSSTMRLC